MMSLGVTKGRALPPTDEDRRRIIKQMKVRTTLKGDKSWIHHHNSDSEDEKSSSTLSGHGNGRSPAPSTPQSDRSAPPKPQSGYLIRGVFTKTIDKTSSVPDSSPNEAQKSSTTKRHSLCRSSSGYRMTTEDYKKLAPYNVKQKSVDLDEEDVPFTPDEHKKRTEAANSVLRRSASRERAYVLSAAKKSSGSPTQEFPPLFAKRVDIEEEGQQRRSSTGSCGFTPDDNRLNNPNSQSVVMEGFREESSWDSPMFSSSTNGLRKATAGSSWNEPKTTASSPSSPETGTKSQTAASLKETSERISTSAEIRNGENEQAPNGKSSSETVSQHGDGDKPLKEKSEPFPWDEQAPRATMVSTNGSYPEHTEANNGFYPPKSNSGCRDIAADATDKLRHQYETSHRLGDAKSEPARSSLHSDVPVPPTEKAPVHLEDTEYSFKRSALGYKERSSSTQESRYTGPEAPAYSKPYWNEAMSSQDLQERNTLRETGHERMRALDDHKPELIQEGFSDSTNHTEKGQEPPAHTVHTEPPKSREHTDHEPSVTRFSSLPRESSITAPETPRGNEPDLHRERITPAWEEQTCPTTGNRHESSGDWRHNEPDLAASRSNFSSDSALSGSETQQPVPLYMDRQPFSTSMSAPSHRIPSYVDSQAFSTRRPTLDYEGRGYDGSSSPRNSRYDSTSARGLCDFSPMAGSYDSLPRDTTMSISQRSHRVPFYMDSLNCNSTRLLSSSSERICTSDTASPHNSPALASGYQPDSSATGKGVLFVKEYMNSSELSASPRYGSGSLVNMSDLERATYSHHRYLSSAPLQRSSEPVCSYCSREIRDCPKIIIEHLNICCHEYCFRCGICHRAMGDLLDKIFIHRDIVHCDKCYEKLF